MNNEIYELTPQERHEFSKALVRQRLKTREDLKFWLLYYLGVDLADCTVSRHATSNPLDMVWEIYQFCAQEVDNDLAEPKSFFFIAGRASQKTLSCAVLQIILPLHFGRGVVHFGGTDDQANRAYTYFKKFVNRKYIKPYLKDDPKISETVFIIDGEEVSVEILCISPASVQGPHQPVVSLDELSSLAPNKVQAYSDISGVPVYTRDGKPWVKFGISSRKGKHTIIEAEHDAKDETGVIFKFWTVFENSQRCPDSISGTEPLTMYVDVYENQALLEEDYKKLDEIQQGKFERREALKGCFNCPLKAVCAGDLKKQTSTCRTLKPIRATISEFRQAKEYGWYLSQKMSLQPSAEGMVYPKFKKIIFEKTPREIYTIFSGTDPGRDITVEQLVEMMLAVGVKRYAGLDHGYTHPTAIIIIYEDSVGNAYIMETYEESGLEPPEVVEMVKKFKEKYKFTIIYPDTASPAVNKMFKKFVTVGDEFTKKPEEGIALIRAKMCPSSGGTKLYGIKGQVKTLVDNFEKYHFAYNTAGKLTDKPVKENDDSHDGLSYAAQNRWSREKSIIIPSDSALPMASKPETKKEYSEKVQKQYDNWLSQQIRATTQSQGGSSGVQTSKNGNFFWDID